jgi:DNA-binding transcriptional ArsR family regulator
MVAGETDLVDDAIARLRVMLPAPWTIERSGRAVPADGSPPRDILANATIDLRAPNGTSTTFAVEAKQSFGPRDVEKLSVGLSRTIRSIAGFIPILVVAPWLSARTRELLVRDNINFLDLTGNAFIKLENPALYIKADGATRNPQPAPRGRATVRGPKAARLIRLLVDVRPPYGVGEIAAATSLAAGYVSRLLDALDREALIERARRGRVDSVDIAGLLRRWAESYDVLKTNEATFFLAPNGAKEALSRLAERSDSTQVTITGSFAALRLAPVAAPALLLAYSNNIEAVAGDLGLLPADEGANVALLRAFDPVVWERGSEDSGVRYVAPSQAVVDCLTGNGRMPAEGEALIAWMTENEPRWRLSSIEDLGRSGGVHG